MKFISILFSLLTLLSACSKTDVEADKPKGKISDVPYIELRDFSPKSISQFDSVVFSIFYQDGDGDLGQAAADSFSLWITDQRFPLTQGFHIPPLSPVDSAITIQGVFQVTLRNIILENQSASEETVKFSIEMRDRAGNSSNVLETGELLVKK